MVDILCTLGPSSMNDQVIRRLSDMGVTLFRINLSHTSIEDLDQIIEYIRERTSVPICIDTEGAQIRTSTFSETTVTLREHSFVRVSTNYTIGSMHQFNLYPKDVVNLLEVDDFLTIDFDSALVQVVEAKTNNVTFRVINGGRIGSNKAVTINRNIKFPPLTDKDLRAISIGKEKGIKHFALSFTNSGSDVKLIRELAGRNSFIISKIESRLGLSNLEEICKLSDAILIDRGDLSREIAVEKIPIAQKIIINNANKLEKKTYVATNLLESMVSTPTPTRAEINDVYNTLLDGASGLVLAAETAIGQYPIECVRMISQVISEFKRFRSDEPGYDLSETSQSQLIEPHGGKLIQSKANKEDWETIDRLKTISVNDDVLSDCQLIATGAYSPLTGFMDKSTLDAVLEDYKLPSGLVWPMPIVLQVTKEIANSVAIGERVILSSLKGESHAVIDITDVFPINIDIVANQWFGTPSRKHPGVERFSTLGSWLISGPIKLLKNFRQENSPYNLTPQQCRYIFSHKKWKHVVGFHTRNVVHRAHEHIQLKALEDTRADGLFINPILGSKKPGDFLSDPIIKSYQLLLETNVYPPGKVVLGSFSTYSRYSGPREALFTALCRKNMGCDYFIIGRDHTGVGDYYGKNSAEKLFDRVGDIGISPVYFETVGFNQQTGEYSPDPTDSMKPVSASRLRDSISNRQHIDDWLVRSSVQEMLFSELDAGKKLFHD